MSFVDAYNNIFNYSPKALIFSGSPSTVYEAGSPTIDEKVFELGLPILGICYGMQLYAHKMGGKTVRGESAEFGKTEVTIVKESPLFVGIPKTFDSWMSHYDEVVSLPQGCEVLANTPNCANASIYDETHNFYGVQFHPEVVNCEYGQRIIANFLKNIAHCKCDWSLGDFAEQQINAIREKVGDRKVLCACREESIRLLRKKFQTVAVN